MSVTAEPLSKIVMFTSRIPSIMFSSVFNHNLAPGLSPVVLSPRASGKPCRMAPRAGVADASPFFASNPRKIVDDSFLRSQGFLEFVREPPMTLSRRRLGLIVGPENARAAALP